MKYHLIEEQLPTGPIIPDCRDFKSIIKALQTPSTKKIDDLNFFHWLFAETIGCNLQNCFATSATIRHKQTSAIRSFRSDNEAKFEWIVYCKSLNS